MKRWVGFLVGLMTSWGIGTDVSKAMIQVSNTQTIQISHSPPVQKAGPFLIFGIIPLPIRKGFKVTLELDVTHAVRVEVGDRLVSFSGKGGHVSGSGRIGLQKGQVYPVKETYVFKASVDSIFIKGEFPVEFTIEWELPAQETGVYVFGITGNVQDLEVTVTEDVTGEFKAEKLGNRIVLPIVTIRDIPGGEELTYGATFTGKFERTSTLDWTGQKIPEWDVNSDGITNIVDLVLVARRLGKANVVGREDINGDKVINIVDLVLIARHFGESLDYAAAPSLARMGKGNAPIRLAETPFQDGRKRFDLIADPNVPLAGYDVTLTVPPEASAESPWRFFYRVPTPAGYARFVGVLSPFRKDTVGPVVLVSLVTSGETPQVRNLTLVDADAQLIPTRWMPLPPERTTLRQNFPNPFNPETWIPFSLATSGRTRIEIFDVKGQRVRTLDLGVLEAGEYTSRDRAAYWDGKNDLGEPVSSGVYFYRLTAKDTTETRRMTILR